MRKLVLFFCMAVSLVLCACGSAEEKNPQNQEPTPTETAAPTETPVLTETPTPTVVEEDKTYEVEVEELIITEGEKNIWQNLLPEGRRNISRSYFKPWLQWYTCRLCE